MENDGKSLHKLRFSFINESHSIESIPFFYGTSCPFQSEFTFRNRSISVQKGRIRVFSWNNRVVHFGLSLLSNQFDCWILGNRVNRSRINRTTYKLTLKPSLFDCATFAFVYFDYYANRYFSVKYIHRNQSYQSKIVSSCTDLKSLAQSLMV